MKNLESFYTQKLSETELQKMQGGKFFRDWLLGEAISAVFEFIAYDNEGYGRRMYETGSPGGHK